MNYNFFWGGVFSNFHPINGDEAFTSEKIFMGLKGGCVPRHSGPPKHKGRPNSA